MKRKRIPALLLCLALCLSCVTTPALAAAPTEVVAPGVAYATDAQAFVKKIQVSQSADWGLTVTADTTNAGSVYAVLLRYDIFDTNYNSDGKIGAITSGTYHQLKPGLAAPNYYRSNATTVSVGSGHKLFDGSLYDFTKDSAYKVGESSTSYTMKYALIIFDGGTSVANLSDYTIATFRMDSRGKLQTESYMVRYMSNNGSAGANKENAASLPAYQTEGWTTGATVVYGAPTRKGYEFMGWGNKSQKDVMGTVANDAANKTPTSADTAFTKAEGKTNLEWSVVSGAAPGFNTQIFDREKDRFYDLYAIWKPYRATFHAESETLKQGEGVLQVNVPFEQAFTLASPTSADTGKTYSVSGAVKLPAGLSVSGSGNTGWKISGTPTKYTTVDTVVTVLVTDNSNGTSSTIELTVPPILKGAQEMPDADVNTGLEADALTPQTAPEANETQAKDGVIHGFYSLGNTTANADGTGSLRGYYLDTSRWTEALVYEYKPQGEAYTEWREVPLPKDVYTPEEVTKLAPSMAAEAQARASTSRTKDGTTISESAGAKWTLEYGYITWSDGTDGYGVGTPVVHGLKENAVYEVRFKENKDYGASKAVPITITAGGGGGSGSVGTDGVKVVTLFDWDNSYLGSVAVPTGATAAEVNQAIEDYRRANAAMDTALNSKLGYDFTHWTDSAYDGLLAWGDKSKVNSAAGNVLEDIPRPPDLAFEELTGNISVKAAYESSEVKDLTALAQRNYMFDPIVTYNKMGTTTFYSITVTIHRKNTSGEGVQRLGIPAVRGQMTTTIGNVFQLATVEQTDTASATFAVNAANTTQILCAVIDTYGISNWSSGAAQRGTLTIKSGTPDNPGFIFYGTLAFVNEQIAPGGTIGQVTQALLQDNLGLNLGGEAIANVRNYLKSAQAEKGADLTIEEMQAAIDNKGTLS